MYPFSGRVFCRSLSERESIVELIIELALGPGKDHIHGPVRGALGRDRLEGLGIGAADGNIVVYSGDAKDRLCSIVLWGGTANHNGN